MERWEEIEQELLDGGILKLRSNPATERAAKRIAELDSINRGVYEQMSKALPVPPLCSGDNTIEGVRQMRLTMESQRGEVRKLRAEVDRLGEALKFYADPQSDNLKIKQLKESETRFIEVAAAWKERAKKAQAEIKRLEAALRNVVLRCESLWHDVEYEHEAAVQHIMDIANKALGKDTD